MKYYLLSAGNKKQELKETTLFLGTKESIKDTELSINWMRKGSFEDDFRCVKRISKLGFQCVETKEVFEIDENNPKGYTKQAWIDLINEWKN
tara:strand:+ start:1354 stop:1629 length:276 start_codon:yes stop_codon:yes gene_type:complete